MEIKTIQITKILPDKNQPRKTFDKETLKLLAETYKQQGVIEPIEVDEQNIIVTGERRFRAAKMAGFKTIQCKVNKNLSEINRLQRQLIEDVQKEEIPIPQRDKAWHNLYIIMLKNAADFKHEDLAKILGVNVGSVNIAFERLGFYEKEPELSRKLSPTMISETSSLPHKERVEVLKDLKNKKISSTKEVIRRTVKEKHREIKLNTPTIIPIEKFDMMFITVEAELQTSLNRFLEVMNSLAEKGVLQQMKSKRNLQTIAKSLHDSYENVKEILEGL